MVLNVVNNSYKIPESKTPAVGSSKLKTVVRTGGRPLVDKTPFPNRNANVQLESPSGGKLGKLDFGGSTPDSALRPSSLRRNSRAPRGSLGRAFETPINTGDHWNSVDDSISLQHDTEPIAEDVFDDTEEVEYGPPNTLGWSQAVYDAMWC
jgi:hypothetical protein